jgi:hypothetical protein
MSFLYAKQDQVYPIGFLFLFFYCFYFFIVFIVFLGVFYWFFIGDASPRGKLTLTCQVWYHRLHSKLIMPLSSLFSNCQWNYVYYFLANLGRGGCPHPTRK